MKIRIPAQGELLEELLGISFGIPEEFLKSDDDNIFTTRNTLENDEFTYDAERQKEIRDQYAQFEALTYSKIGKIIEDIQRKEATALYICKNCGASVQAGESHICNGITVIDGTCRDA